MVEILEDAVPPTGISENGSCQEALESMSGTTVKRSKSSMLNQHHEMILDGYMLERKKKGKLVETRSAEYALQSRSNRQLPHLPRRLPLEPLVWTGRGRSGLP